MLLADFIQANFVADGMCADVCIHETDGRNPHAHIMLTVRSLEENGKWQNKTEKEYLCVRGGEERGFTAAEFKAAQAESWEKQYQCKPLTRRTLPDMKKVEGEISKSEARILKLDAQEVRITGAINREKEKLDEGGMTERREERKRLRRMEERQRPKRKTRARQQER